MVTSTTSAPALRLHRSAALAAVADGAAVLAFAAAGRRSHDEGTTAIGVLDTAWPFLTGAALGWVASRAWRRPAAVVPVGVTVWGAAWAVGMVLRRATGDGTAVPFVLVALGALGALLLGWRGTLLLSQRLRGRSS